MRRAYRSPPDHRNRIVANGNSVSRLLDKPHGFDQYRSVPHLPAMRLSALALFIVPATLFGQAQPVPQTTAKPGWQWTMDSVRSVVNEVRAGRSLQPRSWPNGAKVAVLL